MTIEQSIASPIAAPRKGRWYRSLYAMVIIALIAGILVGHFFPDFGASLKPLGDAFIKLVKMIISPVIFCTVVVGIAGMSDLERVGKVGGKALTYFLVVSSFALVVGLVVANVVRPGAGLNIDPATLDPAAISEYQGKAKDQTLVDFLLAIIPDTFVGAFSSGLVLQTLFVAILTGVALALLGPAGERIVDGFRLANKAVFKIVHIAMLAAPIGVFGAMAFTT